MSSTGKNEIMASIFAIASNDFMTENHDNEQDTHLEVPTNQPAVPKMNPNGGNVGTVKARRSYGT
jgi:hypothetical protein